MKGPIVVPALIAALCLAGTAAASSAPGAPGLDAGEQLDQQPSGPPGANEERALATRSLSRRTAVLERRTHGRERPREGRRRARRTVWDRLARCETGGNWKHRNSTYQGGLGFHHRSWDAYRPRRFPAEAYLATREQQIVVAKRILADVGWGAWPACSIRLGLR